MLLSMRVLCFKHHVCRQRIVLFPGHAIHPCEVLEIDMIRVGVTSLADNKHLLSAVYKVPIVLFAFPLPSQHAKGVACELLQLHPIFGVPKVIQYDQRKDSDSIVIQHVCRSSKAHIQLGLAEHPRARITLEICCRNRVPLGQSAGRTRLRELVG